MAVKGKRAVARRPAKKGPARKSPAKKAPAKKAAAKKAPAKKAAAKKAPAKKRPAVKKAAAKKPAAKKTVAKKAPAKKAAAKKTAPKRRSANKTPAAKRATAPTSLGDRPDSVEGFFEPYKPKRGEKYMSEDQKMHFRHILLAWKSQLMAEVDRTVNHMKDEAAKFPDPTDRASQEEEFNLELKTRDRERKLIRKIDSTLDLIDMNDYGYCVTCGVEIGIRRLEARPTATQCIDCKTLDEIKERQILGA